MQQSITRMQRQDFFLTNLEKDGNFGVNFEVKTEQPTKTTNGKHSERQSNHQIDD